MERNELRKRNLKESVHRKAGEALLVAAIGTTIAAGVAHGVYDIIEKHAVERKELLKDTTTYTVVEGGYLSEVAAQFEPGDIPDKDIGYMVGILEDLNPDYAQIKVIPDNTDIVVPRAFLGSEDDSSVSTPLVSVDLKSNTAKVNH